MLYAEETKLLLQTYPGSLGQSLSRVQISTMAVKDNLLVAGGFKGELLCKVRIRSYI